MQQIAGSPVKHISAYLSPVKQVSCGTALQLVAQPINAPKMISSTGIAFLCSVWPQRFPFNTCAFTGGRWGAHPSLGYPQQSAGCMEEPPESLHRLDAGGSPAASCAGGLPCPGAALHLALGGSPV